MVKTSTHKIEVSVECNYLHQQSIPREGHYFFIYYITILNKSEYAVKLIKRHWDIFDSNGEKREVEGDGVVGETPELAPGESFAYNSGCNLVTEMGYMKGYYTLIKLLDNSEFTIAIPQFELIVPAKLN
jgi:ApaG protein